MYIAERVFDVQHHGVQTQILAVVNGFENLAFAEAGRGQIHAAHLLGRFGPGRGGQKRSEDYDSRYREHETSYGGHSRRKGRNSFGRTWPQHLTISADYYPLYILCGN